MDAHPEDPGLLVAPAPIRASLRVEGVVQGVGFRPFIHRLAQDLGLSGFVGNDPDGVFCEVEGPAEAVESFVAAIREAPPPMAVVEKVTVATLPVRGQRGFMIVDSHTGVTRSTLVSADTATCEDCIRELFDPSDRRHRYPFINCTNCGPRFTIVRDIPYDRPNTTMAGFTMCPDCAREYHDPTDRRFHAQPVCCPDCGPALHLVDGSGGTVPGDPIQEAAEFLASGRILAVKGLGGFHLAVLAGHEPAARELRARKHREDKPFAVMVPDLAAARSLCDLRAADEELLVGVGRPVVLGRRRPDAGVAPSVAPGNRWLGVMLPYTPVHHLLARSLNRPFVLTSGNISDEPIAYRDEDAFRRLHAIADGFLVHDRPIHVRTDDSVVRTFRDRPLPVRRSRGYAPQPIQLARPVSRPVLGCGAELKNTFCLASGRHAFVSHHIGDLENFETLRSFTEGVSHFRRLFGIEPELVVHDLHPEYLSTKFALELDGVDLAGVQHHHAHIASCLADNGEAGPVIGVAFDGLGYGTDGTLWGGEFLIADLAGFSRAGHLAPVVMAGGGAAVKEPWRMAAAWLDATGTAVSAPGNVAARHRDRWEDVLAVARSGVNSPVTSSAGRLFDAVAALAGVRDVANYEGQAAVELEQAADPDVTDAYEARATPGSLVRLEAGDLIAAVAADVDTGVDIAVVSARFHNGLARASVRVCIEIARRTGLDTVALSGGVFQNALFLARVYDGLAASGLRVLVHSRVPPNDGGISLGQVAIGGA